MIIDFIFLAELNVCFDAQYSSTNKEPGYT